MKNLSIKQLRDWCRANNKPFHIDVDGNMLTMNEAGTDTVRHTTETLTETVLGAQSDPACGTGSRCSNCRMRADGYESLSQVLQRAFAQAAFGKGAERHANALPFDQQPMTAINAMLGSVDGFLYQAIKKTVESKRLPRDRAVAELLGAINYLAGAIMALERGPDGVAPAAANDNTPMAAQATA